MKDNVHPEKHAVCFIDVYTGRKFVTQSSQLTKQKDVIDLF
jgi:ribosomal protein L31